MICASKPSGPQHISSNCLSGTGKSEKHSTTASSDASPQAQMSTECGNKPCTAPCAQTKNWLLLRTLSERSTARTKRSCSSAVSQGNCSEGASCAAFIGSPDYSAKDAAL